MLAYILILLVQIASASEDTFICSNDGKQSYTSTAVLTPEDALQVLKTIDSEPCSEESRQVLLDDKKQTSLEPLQRFIVRTTESFVASNTVQPQSFQAMLILVRHENSLEGENLHELEKNALTNVVRIIQEQVMEKQDFLNNENAQLKDQTSVSNYRSVAFGLLSLLLGLAMAYLLQRTKTANQEKNDWQEKKSDEFKICLENWIKVESSRYQVMEKNALRSQQKGDSVEEWKQKEQEWLLQKEQMTQKIVSLRSKQDVSTAAQKKIATLQQKISQTEEKEERNKREKKKVLHQLAMLAERYEAKTGKYPFPERMGKKHAKIDDNTWQDEATEPLVRKGAEPTFDLNFQRQKAVAAEQTPEASPIDQLLQTIEAFKAYLHSDREKLLAVTSGTKYRNIPAELKKLDKRFNQYYISPLRAGFKTDKDGFRWATNSLHGLLSFQALLLNALYAAREKNKNWEKYFKEVQQSFTELASLAKSCEWYEVDSRVQHGEPLPEDLLDDDMVFLAESQIIDDDRLKDTIVEIFQVGYTEIPSNRVKQWTLSVYEFGY